MVVGAIPGLQSGGAAERGMAEKRQTRQLGTRQRRQKNINNTIQKRQKRQKRQPKTRQRCVGTGSMDAAIARRGRWQ